jgi:predicted hotdog family 3-hydroxylacyl-ACP dehydratase
MMGQAFPAVADLLPHGAPMVLLDDVLDDTDASLTACVTIRPDSQFAVAGEGVPAHVGIEYMAQACGAFAGLAAHRNGLPVRLGFLLGTRRYHASVPWFRVGWRLAVTMTVVFREGQMGVFDCRVRHGATEVAAAQITLYQPDDPAGAPVAGHEGLQ